MKKKPLIAITSTICPKDTIEYRTIGGSFRNAVETSVLQSAYSNWIEKAGGIPVTIPIPLYTSEIISLIEKVDGVLLSGGDDLAPSFYNERPLAPNCNGDLRRTWIETVVIRDAIQLKKPIFGICRGIQQLNVVLGGSLYQDIPIQMGNAIEHSQSGMLYAHTVLVESNEFTNQFFGKSSFQTNSSHHQAIKKVGDGGIVLATAEDGVIEAVTWKKYRAIGVQWHPERIPNDEVSQRLANWFVDICANRATIW